MRASTEKRLSRYHSTARMLSFWQIPRSFWPKKIPMGVSRYWGDLPGQEQFLREIGAEYRKAGESLGMPIKHVMGEVSSCREARYQDPLHIGAGDAENFIHDGQNALFVRLDIREAGVVKRKLHGQAVACAEIGCHDNEAVTICLILPLSALPTGVVVGPQAMEGHDQWPSQTVGATAVVCDILLRQVKPITCAGPGLDEPRPFAPPGLLRDRAAALAGYQSPGTDRSNRLDESHWQLSRSVSLHLGCMSPEGG